MSHKAPPSREVFISHSTKDKRWADAACAVLEQQGIRCWIAPRDILHGPDWAGKLVEGIDACKIMVLIFSAHANASEHVRREVVLAIGKGMTVLPFRVENVSPEGALKFALSNTQWLDGFTPPLHRHLNVLAGTVETLVGGSGLVRLEPPPVQASRRRKCSLVLSIGLSALAVVGGTGVYFWVNQGVVTMTAEERVPVTPSPVYGDPLEVGARVRVTKQTGWYITEGAVNPEGTVQVGWEGEVLEAPRGSTYCQVRFDSHLSRNVWISRDDLEVE